MPHKILVIPFMFKDFFIICTICKGAQPYVSYESFIVS